MSQVVIDYLKNNSVKSLENIGVYARWSTKNPNKFSLNYDQIEAKDMDILSQHSRGLVLEQTSGNLGEAGDYRVLARPFYRFFNFGQQAAAVLDWDSSQFIEKLDGTLCIVYFDDTLGEWCVATRSVPDADIPTQLGLTFSELFWQHFSHSQNDLKKGFTYLFELCGPQNQIVVVYEFWSTTLLGVFDNNTCKEIEFDNDFIKPKKYSLSNYEEAVAFINSQPGMFFEGCIVVDKNLNRVKIKNSQYLAVAKVIQSTSSDLDLARAILEETLDDAIPYIAKERVEKAEQMKERLLQKSKIVDEFVASLDKNSSRKDVALTVMSHDLKPWMSAVMDMWSGSFPTNSLLAWIKFQKEKHNGFRPSFVEFIYTQISD